MTDKTAGPILELRDVTLEFESGKSSFEQGVHTVLDSISLQVFQGDTLGIIGKNGCGKTTILRLMAGIIPPTSGLVRQRPGTTSALLSLGLGFKPELSGRDNATIAAMLQGATQKQAESHLENIKEFSELEDSFEEPVKTYSSGMKSRLGFTTALLTDVSVMLIDEVLSVGDIHFRKKAREALKRRITGHQTVVFVSHSGPDVKALCDRAIWLNEGRVAAEGSSVEVLEIYETYMSTI